MSDWVILILNTVLWLVAVACLGNLIVGGFLNAIRESKGKEKKKRTSLIIFDILMICACLFVYSVTSRNSEPVAEEQPKRERWYVIADLYNSTPGAVTRFNNVVSEVGTYEECKSWLDGLSGWGNVTYKKVGCGKNCDIAGDQVNMLSSCEELKK